MFISSFGGPANDQEMKGRADKVQKLVTELNDKAMSMLTEEQRGKLDTLQGKKFDVASIKPSFQLFGGRAGRRGGQ